MKRNNTLIATVLTATSALLLPSPACYAQKISGGGEHSYAICSDSTLMAWGDNYNGVLGNGNTIDSNIPVVVNTLTAVTAVAGGMYHCLALKDLASGGTVWSWGYNNSGALGNGTNTASYVPLQVSSLTGITAIAAGEHSLALKNDSTVWAWGENSSGQLGNGTNTNSNVPVQVISLTGVIAIAGGIRHSFALKNDGTAWAWGANFSGQLGNGANMDKNFPVQVSSLTGIIAVAAGYEHSLALKNDGTVWAWGINQFGTLGNGNNISSNVPVQVSILTDIIAIGAGSYHCIALKNDGTVWAWGWNWRGQLGNGNNIESNVPVQVSSLTDVVAIEGGEQHSLALKSDGTVWTWGWNQYGQLGNGNNIESNIPVQVTGLCLVATAVNEITEPLNISVFPNPAANHLYITFAGRNQKADITISDITGKIITIIPITIGTTTSGATQRIEVDATNISNGLYIARIQDEENIEMKKFMIQK